MIAFIEQIRQPARAVLADEIRRAPEPGKSSLYTLGAVDSAHAALTTAGPCGRLPDVNSPSEDHRFAHAHLDPGAEIEPVARVMRSHFEAELLADQPNGDKQLILDNSFLSLAMAASQAAVHLNAATAAR